MNAQKEISFKFYNFLFCFYNFLWCRFLSFLFFLMLLLFIIIIIIIFHAQFGSFFRE